MSSTENNYVNTDLGNVALNSCGEYNADSSYEYLDTVNYEGGSYFCKVEFPKKISGIAPKAGVSTEFCQLLTIPGDVTSEYIKLHDEVVNKAKQVETSRAAVELSQQEIEAAQADVSQMRQDTQEAAEEAASSRDSAAGYAQSAETSRTAAKESEDNINAQVTEFDTHVAEKTSAAETAITEARRAAVSAVSTKQDNATQAVTDEGNKQIKKVEDTGTEQIGKAKSAGASAVSAAGAAGVSAVNAVKAQQTASIKAIQEADENALQNISNGVDKGLSEEGKAADAKATGEAISKLTEDLSNKITKFYASNQGEAHITDSDNGKIQDMMLYGKSEQKQYSGKNLLEIRDGTQTARGITVTAKDGVVEVKGIATESGWAIFNIDSFVLDGTHILSSNITADTRVKIVNKSFKTVMEQDKSATLENVEVSRVCFVVTKGETYDVSNILIQIEKGSVATSYEPYTGGIPSPNPSYPQEIKSVVNPTVKLSNEDGTQSETVTLPYTLNAIPVSSGGNVTIDGQQYIADYVDVEKGKLYRKVKRFNLKGIPDERIAHGFHSNGNGYLSYRVRDVNKDCIPISNQYIGSKRTNETGHVYTPDGNDIIFVDDRFTDKQTAIKLIQNTYVIYAVSSQTEEDLSLEQIKSLKSLSTYYPVTNIAVGSEQLDGYTIFNYPISMENGWNYVKQQLNDNRDYIYDMDLQSAEAYVNSEYAVALTELEE